jgi:hypothetical protein
MGIGVSGEMGALLKIFTDKKLISKILTIYSKNHSADSFVSMGERFYSSSQFAAF